MMHRLMPVAALLALALSSLAAAGTLPGAPPVIPAPNGKLTLTGTLATGVMAIGGETTGTTLAVTATTGNVTYELDIKDPALKKTADTLNGKSVTVTGTLTLKQGIETGQRRIVTVDSLAPAKLAIPATQPK